MKIKAQSDAARQVRDFVREGFQPHYDKRRDDVGSHPKWRRLLDIGCGWGGLAKYAAERYGCRMTGVNISNEQLAFGRDFCRGLPVRDRHAQASHPPLMACR